MLFDLKVLKLAVEQLQEEKNIPRDKTIEAIEMALAAAYKKEYGRKGQIVRAQFNMDTGDVEFSQVKIAVDETSVKMEEDDGEDENAPVVDKTPEEMEEDGDLRPRYNPEQHILIEDAEKMKKGVKLEDELVFPLEEKEDFGRIAAQTAKQVIIQKIREAEKVSVIEEFGKREGEIVSGTVQRVERGNIFVDLGKATGIMGYDDQIPRERYRQGERVRAYLYAVDESPKGISLRLSRSHPKFIEKLFESEAPEIASGVVEIKSIVREPGFRAKMAVYSTDEHIDPIGSCVGQRGVRVTTVMSELGGEKIDIIEWSDEPEQFIADALSPAKASSVQINEESKSAVVKVAEDQLSLAIGKGGQNARLAARLTGWRIDIQSLDGETEAEVAPDPSDETSQDDSTETTKEDTAKTEATTDQPEEGESEEKKPAEDTTEKQADEQDENEMEEEPKEEENKK